MRPGKTVFCLASMVLFTLISLLKDLVSLRTDAILLPFIRIDPKKGSEPLPSIIFALLMRSVFSSL